METLKKKDLKKYKPKKKEIDEIEDIDEVEEIDELVGPMGDSLSGDKPTIRNNSEIETAPQATTDDFNQVAIQPNRYLYNFDSAGGRSRTYNESENKEAKDKMVKLLEELGQMPLATDNEPMTDVNKNNVPDINELSPNVANKLSSLIGAVDKNNLSPQEIKMIIDYFVSKVKNRLESN